MAKKGFMISLMIIIGILILVLLFFAFAMRNQLVDLIKPKVSDVSGVQIYVEDCIDAVSQFAIYKMGIQGGSITLNPAHFSNSFLNVNYAFDGTKTFPALDAMRAEIESFVNNNLKNCTAEFRGFKSKGIDIKEGNVSTSIIMGVKSLIITVDYPIGITSGDKTFEIDKFQRDVPIRLKGVHSETDGFLSGFSSRYNLTYLRNMNSNVYILPYEDTDLFVEEAPDSRILGDNYLFLFAVR